MTTHKPGDPHTMSPPFRDSDAIYIIAKRLERLADRMTAHDYSTVVADMAEVEQWMSWLSTSIESREATAERGDA